MAGATDIVKMRFCILRVFVCVKFPEAKRRYGSRAATAAGSTYASSLLSVLIIVPVPSTWSTLRRVRKGAIVSPTEVDFSVSKQKRRLLAFEIQLNCWMVFLGLRAESQVMCHWWIVYAYGKPIVRNVVWIWNISKTNVWNCGVPFAGAYEN